MSMSKEHWSDYWSMGVLTSLPADFKENYDGELADYWHDVLARTKTDSKILDLCTGNGALAILIHEKLDSLKKNVEITAVDASDISPKKILKSFPNKMASIESINFISNCYVENLSELVSGDFDLVVSQYGIEYCDSRLAAKQVYQVLNTEGRLVFVSHSNNTAMQQYMNVEEQVFHLLEGMGVFRDFDGFGKDKITVNGFKNKLKKYLDQLSVHEYRNQSLLKSWGQNMYQLYHMSNKQLKDNRAQIFHYLKQNLHARARAKDMMAVTEKISNNPDWYRSFIDVGLKLIDDGEIIYKNQHNVGHYYEFQKPN